jgi:hypothetical protein
VTHHSRVSGGNVGISPSFDDLTKAIARRSSRRTMLRRLLFAVVGGAAASLTKTSHSEAVQRNDESRTWSGGRTDPTTPSRMQVPSFNQVPALIQAPALNQVPSFNQAPSFNQVPAFNQATVLPLPVVLPPSGSSAATSYCDTTYCYEPTDNGQWQITSRVVPAGAQPLNQPYFAPVPIPKPSSPTQTQYCDSTYCYHWDGEGHWHTVAP